MAVQGTLSQGGRHAFATTVGLRRSSPLARDAVWIPPRPAATEQRVVLSTRPADRGGDHRGDARGRRSPRRAEGARSSSCSGVEDQRGARPSGERSRQNHAAPCWCAAARAASAVRSGWTAGAGSSSRRGSPCALGCWWARSSACSADPPLAAPAPPPGSARCCETLLGRTASGDGSRRTSSATPTQSRCPAKASPLRSFSGNSVMPTLGITSSYLRGIDSTEIIHAVHERPAPMIPATTGPSPAG